MAPFRDVKDVKRSIHREIQTISSLPSFSRKLFFLSEFYSNLAYSNRSFVVRFLSFLSLETLVQADDVARIRVGAVSLLTRMNMDYPAEEEEKGRKERGGGFFPG